MGRQTANHNEHRTKMKIHTKTRTAADNFNVPQNINTQQAWKLIDATEAANYAHDYNDEPLACKVSNFGDAARFARSAEVEAALEGLLFSVDEMLNGGFVSVTPVKPQDAALIDKVRAALQQAVTAINYQTALCGNYEREELHDPYTAEFEAQQIAHYMKAVRFHHLIKMAAEEQKREEEIA